MKWEAEKKAFLLCKEMETAEPCSCLHFAPHSVIVGCDKFFEIDLKDYSVEEFLDGSDPSLAYAVLGTHHLKSFPVAVLDISSSVTNPEYLLCFHEFAVFVDAYGRKTREEDVKWSHISFAFAFQKPYLFIFHFALVEVLRITSKSFTKLEKGSDKVVFPQQVMLELPNPQFLGTSISHGSIFLSTSSDIKYGELLKLEGNLACPGIEDESISTLDTYGIQSDAGDGHSTPDDQSEFSFTSSVVQSLEETDEDERANGYNCEYNRRVKFENNAKH
ncbi:hypothetical protein J437_LFUL016882 [Ladona fulva]|uniref:CNH domain-containing protein n=1 Tax=Ladona fulva TaxID=123851 RepID=A0A8K0KM14_LADFU|nr:hypothetical protein J437_LFUL016882 [Ladona fulva]